MDEKIFDNFIQWMKDMTDIKYEEVVWCQDQIKAQNWKSIWGYLLEYFQYNLVNIDMEYDIVKEIFKTPTRTLTQIETMKIGFYLIEKKRMLEPKSTVIEHKAPFRFADEEE